MQLKGARQGVFIPQRKSLATPRINPKKWQIEE